MTKAKIIPKAVKDFYQFPVEKWTKKLKKLQDEELAALIKDVLTDTHQADTKAWNVACLALGELDIRPYAKSHIQELLGFRVDMVAKSKICIADHGYSVEVAGIKESALKEGGSPNKIIHPYPYAKAARKVVNQWAKKHADIPLSEYIALHASAEQKQALLENSITYLKTNDRSKYSASFKNRKISIDGKAPKNGTYMFALSADGKKLLVAKKIKGKFQHSSLFGGAPVACSGNLVIKNKKIVKVTLESGHYKPKKENGEMLRIYLSNPGRLGSTSAKKLEIKEWSK